MVLSPSKVAGLRHFRGACALRAPTVGEAAPAPSPMVDQDHAATSVFAFNFNAAGFPTTEALAYCLLGGRAKTYPNVRNMC